MRIFPENLATFEQFFSLFANLIQTLTSEVRVLNHKACGVQVLSPGGGQSPAPNFFFFTRMDNCFNFFFKSGQIYMKHAECAEMKECAEMSPLPTKRAIFNFLVQNVMQCSETNENQFSDFLVYEIWSILYSTFVVNWGLVSFCEPDLERVTNDTR